MVNRLRGALLRGSRMLTVGLVVLSILIFCYLVFTLAFGGENEEQAAEQEIVAQSQESDVDPAAPETENRNVDSYAAYEAKDPFRQLVAPAEVDTDGGEGEEGNRSGGGNIPVGGSYGGLGNGGPTADNNLGGGAVQRAQDSDNDRLNNGRKERLGQDPDSLDTDGDGTRDGADDSNGDGRPDGRTSRRGNGTGGGDGLFDSGGSLFGGAK